MSRTHPGLGPHFEVLPIETLPLDELLIDVDVDRTHRRINRYSLLHEPMFKLGEANSAQLVQFVFFVKKSYCYELAALVQ